MNKRKLSKMEKKVPQMAVRALNAAHRRAVARSRGRAVARSRGRAVASGLPLVMVIGDGLYRVSGTGERELILTLPPRTRRPGGVKRAKK